MQNDEKRFLDSAGCASCGESGLLILGAGQYGVMAAEIAESMGIFAKIAFLDDSYAKKTVETAKYPVIGTFGEIEKFADGFRYGFVAIGNPGLRRELANRLQVNNIALATLVHPSAYVSPSAQVQKGCCIEPNATVQAGVTLGCATFVASGAVIRHNALVGEFCHVDCNAVVETLAVVPSKTHIECCSVFPREKGAINA